MVLSKNHPRPSTQPLISGTPQRPEKQTPRSVDIVIIGDPIRRIHGQSQDSAERERVYGNGEPDPIFYSKCADYDIATTGTNKTDNIYIITHDDYKL